MIAAASSASKLIAQNGGFISTHSDRNIMIGQVQIVKIPEHSIQNAVTVITRNAAKYIVSGNDRQLTANDRQCQVGAMLSCLQRRENV